MTGLVLDGGEGRGLSLAKGVDSRAVEVRGDGCRGESWVADFHSTGHVLGGKNIMSHCVMVTDTYWGSIIGKGLE